MDLLLNNINNSILKINNILSSSKELKEFYDNVVNIFQIIDDEFQYNILGFLINSYHIIISSEFSLELKRFISANFLMVVVNNMIHDRESIKIETLKKWELDFASIVFDSAIMYGNIDENFNKILNLADQKTFPAFLKDSVSTLHEKMSISELYGILYTTYAYFMLSESREYKQIANSFIINIIFSESINNGITLPPNVVNDFIKNIRVLYPTSKKYSANNKSKTHKISNKKRLSKFDKVNPKRVT